MAIMNGLLCIVALCFNGASSLRLQEAPVDLSIEAEDDSLEESLEEAALLMGKHVSAKDIHISEVRNPKLRPQIEQTLDKLNPVIYFIGDSLVRLQFDGMCIVMGEHDKIDSDPSILAKGPRADGPAVADSCTSSRGTMVHSFLVSHGPEAVNLLLKAGAPVPHTIYWNAAMWRSYPEYRDLFEPEAYKKSMHETIDAYIKAAPHAKLVFFLSHATCPHHRRYKNANREQIKAINDMASSVAASRKDGQGRPIHLVDGYNMTLDKCSKKDTVDGRHFPKMVLNEDALLFQTLEE